VPHPLLADAQPFQLLESVAQGHLAVPVVATIACKKEDVVTILTPRSVWNMLHLEPRLLGEQWCVVGSPPPPLRGENDDRA
jgi:hypothetical protein